MEVYRLSRKEYALPLSGKGAAIHGARWNSKGTELNYCAFNRSLAMAEVAVHFSYGTIPSDYRMISIFIPNDLEMAVVSSEDLPVLWNSFPYSNATKKYGDEFVREAHYCLLKVPSAVTQGDFNLLINPHHPDYLRIHVLTVEPFPFDQRLFK